MTFVEGIATLIWILSAPSDADSRAFLGYSAPRWGLILVVIALTGLCGLAFIKLRDRRIQETWFIRLSQPLVRQKIALGSLAVLLLSLEGMGLLKWLGTSTAEALYNRLAPLVGFNAVVSVQILVLLVMLNRIHAPLDKGMLKLVGRLWGIFILIGAVIVCTRFSLDPTTFGWYEYGVPIVSRQVLLLAYITAAIILAGNLWANLRRSHQNQAKASRRETRWSGIRLDVVLVVLIWLGAVFLWMREPVPPTWLTPRPFPPNFEFTPTAMLYRMTAPPRVFSSEPNGRTVSCITNPFS